MVRRVRRHARRSGEVLRPLFPGYLFVHVWPERESWRPILSTIGVHSLIRFGERLGLLDDDFIQGLRDREQDGTIVRPPAPYRKGQQVRLVGGAFDGVVAEILSVDAGGRLEILMDLLQSSVKATVSPDQVFVA